MDKKILVVDSQKLNAIQACMKKYQYQFGSSFEPQTTPVQFEKGSLMHYGLEFYYKALKVRDKWAESGVSRADVVQDAVDYIREQAVVMSIDMEEVEEVIRVFMEYCTYYNNDGWDNVLAVEETGSKIMYEDEECVFVYEFKIDLVIGLQNYPALPVDHKTYSRKSPTSDMNNQFLGYCWALGVHNIAIDKIGFQKTVKPAEKFVREILSYNSSRIEEWLKNSIFWLKQAKLWMENDIFPMNLTSCDKYSGCTFRSVCMKSPEDREEHLKNLFQIRGAKWDVGSHLE